MFSEIVSAGCNSFQFPCSVPNCTFLRLQLLSVHGSDLLNVLSSASNALLPKQKKNSYNSVARILMKSIRLENCESFSICRKLKVSTFHNIRDSPAKLETVLLNWAQEERGYLRRCPPSHLQVKFKSDNPTFNIFHLRLTLHFPWVSSVPECILWHWSTNIFQINILGSNYSSK